MNLQGRTVAFDYDGVISTYENGWQGPVPTDPPVPGALETIVALQAMGAHVVIYSTRAAEPEGLKGIQDWLVEHNYPPLPVTDRKPKAIAYVDDRAVTFKRNANGRGNWHSVLEQIEDLAIPRH